MAMRLIGAEGLGASDSAVTISQVPGISAHSCHICRQFKVERIRPGSDSGLHFKFQSKSHRLSKEILTQGFSRGCLLVQWILTQLDSCLTSLKSDSFFRNVYSLLVEADIAPSELENLRFIDTEYGVLVWLFANSWHDYDISLSIEYRLEPFLADKLYDTAEPELDTSPGAKYIGFHHNRSSRRTEKLMLSTASDDPLSADIKRRPTLTDLEPEETFEMAKKWLFDCHDGSKAHDACSSGQRVGILPSRILDLGSRYPVRLVRLHWTDEGATGQYAALSYCWGGPQPIVTNKSNAQDFTDGILFSRFPKTIQDAITTTSRLGLRYLWIDCLCILQDDPEDLSREIANMANIFQQAYVTIVAGSSRNVHEGFLKLRSSPKTLAVKLPYECAGTEDAPYTEGSIFLEKASKYSAGNDPINLRAWTLQEQILSPRMLIYSTNELWWACGTSTFSSVDPYVDAGDLSTIRLRSRRPKSPLEEWRFIVRDYSRRFLTFPMDKLPAIAGVAAEYSNIIHSSYLAGMWQVSLNTELMWSPCRPDISRPLHRRAPSWSWASVDGEISHIWCLSTIIVDSFQVLMCRVTPASPSSPFGSIDLSRTILRVEGDLAKVFWRNDKTYIYVCDGSQGEGSTMLVGRTLADADEYVPQEDGSLVVWALALTKNPPRGLLLAHISGDEYRRVGIFIRIFEERRVKFERTRLSIV
ncbi:HET-domain-containing protein [Corynespora cassiicola Philippines]|uniref:HET-domain-containing protein n=1 Tax=Corynespora cassiicola Philippines TaxID=1448308 RepID=A0A2T2NBC8_CORCC|nr:HET-domain-containing protein [Corynespora cassiicola Philippines]